MKEEVINAAIAGLLHDVGKFAQRAGLKPSGEFDEKDYGKHGYHAALSNDFVAKYVPKHLRDGLTGVLYHHNPQDNASQIIQLADWWASAERRSGSIRKVPPNQSRLLSILANVELHDPPPDAIWEYPLAPLQVDTDTMYPQLTESQNADVRADYAHLWAQMESEMEAWKRSAGSLWEQQDAIVYLTTLLAVFRKYLWCIPSATPWQENEEKRIWPDVSLYDHLRLCSALAACLAVSQESPTALKEQTNPTTALLVRGDLSGIQRFIYRINRPEAETEHIAKRLRGRSFYLVLLMEVIADWLLRQLGLPPNCALFVGGGRFDLLIAINHDIKPFIVQLDQWMLEAFQGELSLQIAICPVTLDDLGDMRKVYQDLEGQLEESKKQKWVTFLDDPAFYQPAERAWHVCRVCQLTPLAEPGTCRLCGLHERIGKHLPHTTHIAWYSGEEQVIFPTEQIVEFRGAPFDTRIAMLHNNHGVQEMVKSGRKVTLYQINKPTGFILPGVSSSFRYIANAAPLARSAMQGRGMSPINAGEVLHFEAIASLSNGAQRLGILKADVDHMGMVMSEGLWSDDKNLRPTISRIATLSSLLDIFFTGHLNRICQQVSKDLKRETDGLFYILYSGGDDLFIVGPWDALLKMALRLKEEFSRFCCFNPNLTISAGYVQVKPHYPTQKFADLVDVNEKKAKEGGRNRICAFDQVMLWNNENNSFADLLQLSKDLQQEILDGNLPRGLIADLGEVYRQHTTENRGEMNPMWTPRLHYTLARRLDPQLTQRLGPRLVQAMRGGNILVPVSIVSLITRKE